jgi:hypothetical protein
MNAEDKKAKTTELVNVANAMLQGEVNLIEGCRRICNLRDQIDSENKVFLAIEGIESDTDHFPLGKFREQCAPDYLKKMDNEMDRYVEDAREDILKACREIIRVFAS